MVSAPMLAIYDSSADTQVEVYTDTSTKALGTVLLQKYAAEKLFQPIVYYKKEFNNPLYNYSAFDGKILATMEALQYWCLYLHGKKFVMHVDHQHLMQFFTQPNLSSHQLCWPENLATFIPWRSIQYNQGSSKILPDAIS